VIILGVDPGLAEAGYAVVEKEGNSFSALHYDVITTSSELTDVERLGLLYDDIVEVISGYQPEHMAVEKLFFNKNVKTAIRVGQARGVLMLAGSRADLSVHEYTPLEVKQAVVGYGRASKHQVQEMTTTLLNLNSVPASDDAADALAVSICHGHNYAVNDKWSEQL